jgi:hypothetical protein
MHNQWWLARRGGTSVRTVNTVPHMYRTCTADIDTALYGGLRKGAEVALETHVGGQILTDLLSQGD